MGRINTIGLDDLLKSFAKISEIPDNVKAEALTAMATVAQKKEKSVGEAKGVRDPESDVHILDHIKINKPKLDKSGGSCDVTFSGTRRRGNTTTRNAEIAFIQEYGADRKGIPAKQFIATALEQAGEDITDAGADIILNWIDKNMK